MLMEIGGNNARPFNHLHDFRINDWFYYWTVKHKEIIMPYIVSDKRSKCDMVVDLMKDLNIQIDGELNYIIFKFIRQTTPDKYNALKNAMGEIEMCKLELYRRLMAVREEQVMLDNGDVK